jgi:hypothetical protein
MTSGWLQGIIDAPWLNLTPGTRLGVIHDEALERLAVELAPVEARLHELIAEQQRAEEERASRDVLRSIQKALREALQQLPPEEYDWFNLHGTSERPREVPSATANETDGDIELPEADDGLAAKTLRENDPHEALDDDGERNAPQFFEFAGPLFSVRIQPASSVTPVDGRRTFRALPRDRAGRRVTDAGNQFFWTIVEGGGRLDGEQSQSVVFHAPAEPGLTRLEVVRPRRRCYLPRGGNDHRDGYSAAHRNSCRRRGARHPWVYL